MATKSIGAGSRDYSTTAAWITYLQGLGAFSEDEIGQHYGYTDGEETVTGTVTFSSIDRNGHALRLEAAPGESIFDNLGSNPLVYNASLGAAIRRSSGSSAAFNPASAGLEIRGMQLAKSSSYNIVVSNTSGSVAGLVFDRCVINHSGANSQAIGVTLRVGSSNPPVFKNCVVHGVSTAFSGMRDCVLQFVTMYGRSGSTYAVTESFAPTASVSITNCAAFNFGSGFMAATSAGDFTGSHNATDYASLDFGTDNQASLTTADQIEGTSPLDLKAKATGDLVGAGGAISGITTDFIGTTRADPPYIGAWENAPGGSGGNPWNYYGQGA